MKKRKISTFSTTEKKRTNFPKDSKFPLLTLRQRGPIGVVSLVRMSSDVNMFYILIKQYFSDRVIRRIEARTRGQSENGFWYLYRRAVITGTLARRVIRQNLRGEPNLKLNRAISKFSRTTYTNDAMRYGVFSEEKGVEAFLKIYKKAHKDVKIRNTGVILHSTLPYIGASPDAIVSCSCHQPALIEIKAPYRLKSVGLNPDGWNILEYLDNEKKLKKSHQYFNQLNLYQGITQIHVAYFVVYANDGIIVDKIVFDEEFFNYQISNIKNYYDKYYLPTVVSTNI